MTDALAPTSPPPTDSSDNEPLIAVEGNDTNAESRSTSNSTMVKGLPKIKANMKPSPARYKATVAFCVCFALGGGYFASTQPAGAGWRDPFSYHPLLMMIGFVGLMGSASITKKLGGYSNTKTHGLMSSLGLLCNFGGLYAIYINKEKYGKPHFTSSHSWGGLATLAFCVAIMLAGGIFLHPDFGVDKQNKAVRFAHHWLGKLVLMLAYFSCFMGLMQLTEDPKAWLVFGLPLLAMIPLAVM